MSIYNRYQPSWWHLSRQHIYVLATFLHISNTSATTDPILTRLFWPIFLGSLDHLYKGIFLFYVLSFGALKDLTLSCNYGHTAYSGIGLLHVESFCDLIDSDLLIPDGQKYHKWIFHQYGYICDEFWAWCKIQPFTDICHR